MTGYSATFREDHDWALREHLIRDDGCERAAYVLFNKAAIRFDPWDRQSHLKLLSSAIVPVPDDHIIESTPTLVTWRTASFISALKRAEAGDQLVGIVHSHPSGLTLFSAQDDANEPELVQLAQNRNGPDTPLLSFIMLPESGIYGRIWINPKYNQPLRLVRVVGDRIRLHYRSSTDAGPAFDRQALAFGAALTRDLRQLRIGIVGCGGTGSAVAMLLARLGVGHLLLIDNDILDVTNLNRLHGARQADADAMRPKVEVVARAITELGLGVKVTAMEAWVGDPGCRDGLRSCDVIFGCTDDNDGRLFLNRLALFYLIPTFDLGLHMKPGDDPRAGFRALDGRVTSHCAWQSLPCLPRGSEPGRGCRRSHEARAAGAVRTAQGGGLCDRCWHPQPRGRDLHHGGRHDGGERVACPHPCISWRTSDRQYRAAVPPHDGLPARCQARCRLQDV